MKYYCQTMNCSQSAPSLNEICHECHEENAGPFPEAVLLPNAELEKAIEEAAPKYFSTYELRIAFTRGARFGLSLRTTELSESEKLGPGVEKTLAMIMASPNVNESFREYHADLVDNLRKRFVRQGILKGAE